MYLCALKLELAAAIWTHSSSVRRDRLRCAGQFWVCVCDAQLMGRAPVHFQENIRLFHYLFVRREELAHGCREGLAVLMNPCVRVVLCAGQLLCFAPTCHSKLAETALNHDGASAMFYTWLQKLPLWPLHTYWQHFEPEHFRRGLVTLMIWFSVQFWCRLVSLCLENGFLTDSFLLNAFLLSLQGSLYGSAEICQPSLPSCFWRLSLSDTVSLL